MSKGRSNEYAKNRRDHFLPKGYLRGFVDSIGTSGNDLFVLYPGAQHWKCRTPTQLGWEPGFYDFAGVQGDRTHPDDEFTPLENAYPKLIADLTAKDFAGWRDHLDTLLSYMQMMRCRSPLYREQFIGVWSKKRGARVLAVDSTGEQHKVSVDSLKLRHFSPRALKDAAIANMLTEMKKGAGVFAGFYWQLRLTSSVSDPFVTSESPLVVSGPDGPLEHTINRMETVLLFPLSWRACLIGRKDPFALEMAGSSGEERRWIRTVYFRTAQKFVVSPCALSRT